MVLVALFVEQREKLGETESWQSGAAWRARWRRGEQLGAPFIGKERRTRWPTGALRTGSNGGWDRRGAEERVVCSGCEDGACRGRWRVAGKARPGEVDAAAVRALLAACARAKAAALCRAARRAAGGMGRVGQGRVRGVGLREQGRARTWSRKQGQEGRKEKEGEKEKRKKKKGRRKRNEERKKKKRGRRRNSRRRSTTRGGRRHAARHAG